MLRRRFLILFLTVWLHTSHCVSGTVDATIHITSPMNGWVLTKTPIALSFFSNDCSGNQDPDRPAGNRGCQTVVLLDDEEVLRHNLDEGSFSGVLAMPLDNGNHEVIISVFNQSDGSMVEAARGQFIVMVDADPWDEEAAFASMYALDSASAAKVKQFGSVREVKSAVMLYHRNIKNVYPVQWVTKCIDTILHQTHKEFDIFELNYGDDEHSVFRWHLHRLDGRKFTFFAKNLQDHAMAMNFLLDTIFADGYDVVFNTNLDDYYAPTRFAKQLEAVVGGAQLVSSYFVRVTDSDAEGSDFIMVDTEPTYMCKDELLGGQEPSAESVRGQLQEEHNVVCHPSVLFTKAFWDTLPALDCEEAEEAGEQMQEAAKRHARRHTQFRPRESCGGAREGERGVVRPLRYRTELPAEDLRLWQRAVLMGGVKVTVVPEILVYYRIHSRQISPQAVDMTREWRDKMFASGDLLHRLRVGLLTICTARYCEHLERHLSDLSSNFLAGHALFHFVFTDQPELASGILQRLADRHSFSASVAYIPGRGYPADTLYRYHYFLEKEQELLHNTDVVFYLDVDLVVAEPILATHVMPTPSRALVGVRHPLQDGGGTPESRPESSAFIPPGLQRACYLAGGFVGGRTPEFVAMSKAVRAAVDADDLREVVAVWHDESHLNHYFALHPHIFRVLPPAYLYPQGWDIPFSRKIVVQKIPHAETRFSTQRFVAPCGPAAGGVCELGEGGLGALLFQVAAAIAVKERVREEDGAWEGVEAALPLNW